MQIGVNWIAPHTLPIIRQLIDEGLIDFCEIMVDNFAHLPAKKMTQVLPDVPFALHIIASRFMEKSPDELNQLAQQLRPWIDDLQPLYVSDHLVQFTTAEGKRLPFITEWDYDTQYDQLKERMQAWQDLLGVPLLWENHASLTARGKNQALFYEKLLGDNHANLLFDFSNAYIAEYNQICPAHAWDALIQNTRHFHVAGFKFDPTFSLALDTHDAPIAEPVLALMRRYAAKGFFQQNKTLVIEFDATVHFERWKNEIEKVRNALTLPEGS